MSNHKDATGYLLALRDEVPYDWFRFACDLALTAINNTISDGDSKRLVSLFLKSNTYTPQSAHPVAAMTTPTSSTSASPTPLRELGDFSNFKKLSSTLNVTFDKRITLIFGTNGSGKSSICESIKILGCPDAPDSPLRNVYGTLTSPPSFAYRFEPDSARTGWHSSHGYGAFSSRIKFFDSTIAFRHITDELRPEVVVELAPFRLEVFDYCRNCVTHLREKIDSLVEEVDRGIASESTVLATRFVEVTAPYNAAITELVSGNHTRLDEELTEFTPPTAEENRAAEEAAAQLVRLKDASTEQGVKLLMAEAAALRRLHASLVAFQFLCRKASPERYNKNISTLRLKSAAQLSLAADILPEGVTVQRFKAFLDSSTQVFTFPGRQGDPCPYCRRPFDADAVRLVAKYHAFLLNTLQQDIATLTRQISEEAQLFESIRDFPFKIEDAVVALLSTERLQEIEACVRDTLYSIPAVLSHVVETMFGHSGKLVDLEGHVSFLNEQALRRDEAVKASVTGSMSRQQEIARLTDVCQKHRYRNTIFENRDDLTKTVAKCKARDALRELGRITDFPTILRRMTNAGKEAHGELVVAEFEKRLDKEYAALSGRGLSDFGIRLIPRGQQQEVAVETHIGDTPIRRVLSEGEQKVHALALFFCEAMSRPCDVFVFDDPSTSFDYNHVSLFVERLRDLVRHYPASQIILFTHNWDLFVQVQRTFNKAGFDSFTEVKVLENCSHVDAYTENLDKLKAEITDILAQPGDLDRSTEERLAGLMRRLIETVVNTHVFNGQRHQFKQKTQNVSAFHNYLKLVPLLHHQADKLSDLYTHLSVSEHDDPRNIYTKRSRAGFQRWYDEILTIEADLLSRRP
jgi:Uncharacterized protein conserved in bacteria